jgi:hypothetical protein
MKAREVCCWGEAGSAMHTSQSAGKLARSSPDNRHPGGVVESGIPRPSPRVSRQHTHRSPRGRRCTAKHIVREAGRRIIGEARGAAEALAELLMRNAGGADGEGKGEVQSSILEAAQSCCQKIHVTLPTERNTGDERRTASS